MVLVVALIFIVLVIASILIVLKALYLHLSFIALYCVFKGIKSIGGILNAICNPFNKLLT